MVSGEYVGKLVGREGGQVLGLRGGNSLGAPSGGSSGLNRLKFVANFLTNQRVPRLKEDETT